MLSSALTEPEPCVPQATDCLWISGLQGRCDTLRYSLPPTLAGGGNAAVQPARMPFYHSPAPPPPQQLLQCPQTPCTLLTPRSAVLLSGDEQCCMEGRRFRDQKPKQVQHRHMCVHGGMDLGRGWPCSSVS